MGRCSSDLTHGWRLPIRGEDTGVRAESDQTHDPGTSSFGDRTGRGPTHHSSATGTGSRRLLRAAQVGVRRSLSEHRAGGEEERVERAGAAAGGGPRGPEAEDRGDREGHRRHPAARSVLHDQRQGRRGEAPRRSSATPPPMPADAPQAARGRGRQQVRRDTAQALHAVVRSGARRMGAAERQDSVQKFWRSSRVTCRSTPRPPTRSAAPTIKSIPASSWPAPSSDFSSYRIPVPARGGLGALRRRRRRR